MRFAREAQEAAAPFDDARELSLRLMALQAVRLCWEAVDLIFLSAGTTSCARKDKPLSRLFRNFAVLRTHAVLQLDTIDHAAARSHFGLER